MSSGISIGGGSRKAGYTDAAGDVVYVNEIYFLWLSIVWLIVRYYDKLREVITC